VDELFRELDRYEQALAADGVKPASVRAQGDRVRHFLRWLAGDSDGAP
jgi:hypothetical protein